jgi:CRP/FNR family transcriptional regulator, cyclic AMP receptor protein
MTSPYGMEMVDSCVTCRLRADRVFCDMPVSTLKTFDEMKFTTAYPPDAILFLEGQEPRGIFVICAGSVKISVSAPKGKTIILKLAEPGEVLGLSAAISGNPYEVTAVTVNPCQVIFVKREDFLRLLKDDPNVCFKVAEQLSQRYLTVCKAVRSMSLSHSASGKLARLLLEWSSKHGESNPQSRLKLSLTREEIAQMIGTSRETVSRILADLKRHQIVDSRGSHLLIRNHAALRDLADDN